MADQISAIAAVVAAIIALGSVLVAHRQARIAVRQTKLQQTMLEDAAQPYIWVDIRPDEHVGQLFQLVLVNQGPTVARDVTLDFDPPLPQSWRGGDEPVGPHQARFASIPPGRRMIWHLGVGWELVASAGPKRFNVAINGVGPYGEFGPIEYQLDLNDYTTTAVTARGTLLGVTRSLDKLVEEVERLANSPNRP